MKMNATSLYTSTSRLILLADPADKSSWSDLYRLVPYLRQSLSCAVCGNLLKEPYTPESSNCQHHVCKNCIGGRKKLKPSCGSGNKITIKRKNADDTEVTQSENSLLDGKMNQLPFKKPSNRSRNPGSKRKGCRCGNATATPGKLTCCGQRCPCYVESKPCTECKCKGCRNPHRADGLKVRPHLPHIDTLQLTLNMNPSSSPSCSGSMDSLDTDSLTMEAMEESLGFSTDYKSPSLKVYTSQIQEVSASLPATILMDEELPASPDNLSSPCEYAQYSPRGTNDTELSPQSTGTQDIMSDPELDA